jgi:hypothetical protein
MALPTSPQKKSVFQVKSALLNPALTSHYELYLPLPQGNAGDFSKIMNSNGIFYSTEQTNIQLSCSEATLPGSSLATIEINNDYTGVTERHAYRRIYDDRIDLTFYVDGKYTVIKFFETWIKYIVNESIAEGPGGSVSQPNFFYTVRYPEEYQTEFSITKFERDYTNRLTYTFLKAYPISISSMPVSYDSSSLLKCTVSFAYTRYYVQELNGKAPSVEQSTLNTPSLQADFNTNSYLNYVNPQFGYDTTGGLTIGNALSSGNSIQAYEGDQIIGAVNANSRQVEAGLPFVGRNRGPLARFDGI